MKGNEAEYNISLKKAFEKPKLKRPKTALNEIKEFVKKHTRIEKILIAKEVNEFIFKNSKNIPRKINAVLFKQKKQIKVYLKNSKELEKDKKEIEKAKETKKAKKTEKKESKDKTKEKDEETKEDKDKKEKELKEKKAKEKAAEAVSIKRK